MTVIGLGLAGLTLTGLALASFPNVALAHGGDSGGLQLPNEVHTVTPEGARAKETLSRIEKDTASAALVKEAISQGKRALQRADGANAAGDSDTAALLSRVALAHATNADSTLRAIAAEKKADAAQTKATELRDKLVRTRTLLAETQAQRGQVTAELLRAEDEAKKASERSGSKEEDRLQKGQKDGPKKSDAKGGQRDKAAPTRAEPSKAAPTKMAPGKAEPKKTDGKKGGGR